MKILIAEDDENMSKILKLYLQREGYSVDSVFNGEEAVSYFENNFADLLILDWMMPFKDGLEVCRELRLLKIPIKIIMLTAKSATSSELQGLTTGADDYIRKPFDMNVLLIKIKKICQIEALLHFKDLTLNPSSQEVLKDHRKLALTKTEYELLRYIMSNQNIVLSREKILDCVWGMDYDGDIRTVDTHIRRLRKKIGGSYIKTIFGSGYVMEDLHA